MIGPFVAVGLAVLAAGACAARGPAAGVTMPAPPAVPVQAVSQPESTGDEAVGQEAAPAPPSKLRFGAALMAGVGYDAAQAEMGFERQGRIGYAIVSVDGALSDRFSYLMEFNPVTETEPLPACGEEHYYYPNTPQDFGPNVQCDNNGIRRVDDYKYLGLDLLYQQGIVRQAYLDVHWSRVTARAGRFVLPVGFWWEDAGSLTSKDAPHIQRINAEANFGVMLQYEGQGVLKSASGGAVLGDGNRFHDYAYFYFAPADLDSNSALTGFAAATLQPMPQIEVRVSGKFGFTGSKVERLPNYFASKRNDHAFVLSGRVSPATYVSLFGEAVRYRWGPTRTSAELVGVEPVPILKTGYYFGADLSAPVGRGARVGVVATYERLSRDDSLIAWLQGELNDVHLGDIEQNRAVRLYLDVEDYLRVGFYVNLVDNPFPWVSGIWPVSGEKAYTGRTPNKWGVVFRLRVRQP